MTAQADGVSSVAGHKVGPGFAVYAATKHAVRALSEGLRQQGDGYCPADMDIHVQAKLCVIVSAGICDESLTPKFARGNYALMARGP